MEGATAASLTGKKRKQDVENSTEYQGKKAKNADFGELILHKPISCSTSGLQVESQDVLLEIEKKNKIIHRLIELEVASELEQVDRRCAELIREYEENMNLIPENETEQRNKLREQYDESIMTYIHRQLKLPIKSSVSKEYMYKVDRKTRGDVLFYLLLTVNNPEENSRTRIIRRLLNYSPILDRSWTWFAMCCSKLKHESTFTQFYKRLRNSPTSLRYLLNEQPQLLLNEWVSDLLLRLVERLSYSDLHQIIINTKDENGRTCLFYTLVLDTTSCFSRLYASHEYDLYKLLSIQDLDQQTALHVNIEGITPILADTYSPKLRQKFIDLVSIRDQTGKTVLDLNKPSLEPLKKLVSQVENNKYVLRNEPLVKIFYRVQGRVGAEEEARCLYEAFNSTHLYNVSLEPMKTKVGLIKQIQDLGHPSSTSNGFTLPPSALIVILLTHGSMGVIYDSKSQPIKLCEVESAMSDINKLNGKPKMLITQCCQIIKSKEPPPPYTVKHDHFCSIMSCVAGQPSERGVFIPKLAEQIKACRNGGNISKIVSRIGIQMVQEDQPQTPIMMSTLKAEFCPANSQWWA